MSNLQTISPERAVQLVSKGAVLVDIREADEHAREHIPGARHHALSRVDRGNLVRPGDDVLVFHCRSGARTRGNAARLAAAAAACQVFLLDGGIDAWKKAGLPVKLDRRQPIDLMRQAQIAAGALALAGVLLGLLGLIGGGGSILAVPLLVYAVGVSSPHVAIGTSAIAVAASAAFNLIGHARKGTVKWPCAVVFALAGIAGAAVGAQLGKMIDGRHLLMLFGALMVIIGLTMLRPRRSDHNTDVKLTRATMGKLLPMLIGSGFLVGALSGFFGIGGGFLIVPGLIGATAMPLINAVGSSLVSVTAFGLTTAASYAFSGLVDWPLAFLFVLGGAIGGLVGIKLAGAMSAHKHALRLVFSGTVIAVGLYVVARSFIG